MISINMPCRRLNNSYLVYTHLKLFSDVGNVLSHAV